MPKDAEIIAVGSELLTPQRMDTNSLIVTEHLNLLGVEVVTKQVIGDDLRAINSGHSDGGEAFGDCGCDRRIRAD